MTNLPSVLFLCNTGLETFIKPIVDGLSGLMRTRFILAGRKDWQEELVRCHGNFDVAWLEWANELAVLMTRDPKGLEILKGKKIVMRCHSYEVLSGLFQNVDITKLDAIVFVAKHVRDVAMQLSSLKDQKLTDDLKIWIIPNGIDVDRFDPGDLSAKTRGTDIAFVGHISHKKGFPLMLHAFRTLPDSYRLHVAGEFQDYRFRFYANHILERFGKTFKDRVKFYGAVKDIKTFLSDKHFIASSSPWEGHPVNVIEGMAMGLKPVVHDFLGASDMYEGRWIWTTVEDFKEIVHGREWEPEAYRQHVVHEGWTSDAELGLIAAMLKDVSESVSIRKAAEDIVHEIREQEAPEVEMEYDPKDIDSKSIGQEANENIYKYDPPSFGSLPLYMQKAFRWLTNHLIKSGDGVGIAVSSNVRREEIYPEVTGYLIPTVHKLGAVRFAGEFALGVLPFQHEKGGFIAPGSNESVVFDTAQVLRGLVHVADHIANIFNGNETRKSQLMNAIKKGCSFLLDEMIRNKWKPEKPSESWSMPGKRTCPDTVDLYAMTPFIKASRLCGMDDGSSFSFDYDLSDSDGIAEILFSDRNMLSHFFFYQIDGLLELHDLFPDKGLRDIAYDLVMKEERFLPNRTPFLIPAFKDLPWICSPGQAQAAICFHKLGMDRRFRMAMDGMRALQNPSGGFWGSYGVPDLKKDPSGVWYFPTSEISWAVKFFLDACMIEEGIDSNGS